MTLRHRCPFSFDLRGAVDRLGRARDRDDNSGGKHTLNYFAPARRLPGFLYPHEQGYAAKV